MSRSSRHTFAINVSGYSRCVSVPFAVGERSRVTAKYRPVVPTLLTLLAKKSGDSKDSFNFESLIQSFKGGSSGDGIMGTIGKLFGH